MKKKNNQKAYHFFDHDKGGSHCSVNKKYFQESQIHNQQRQGVHASCGGEGFRWM